MTNWDKMTQAGCKCLGHFVLSFNLSSQNNFNLMFLLKFI